MTGQLDPDPSGEVVEMLRRTWMLEDLGRPRVFTTVDAGRRRLVDGPSESIEAILGAEVLDRR